MQSAAGILDGALNAPPPQANTAGISAAERAEGEEGADDLHAAGEQAVGAEPGLAADLEQEQPAEPVVLSDEDYDRLEQRGVIVDGEFVSQEAQPIIEQSDHAPRYPALAAPVRQTEEAA